jgi:hypothetical protein
MISQAETPIAGRLPRVTLADIETQTATYEAASVQLESQIAALESDLEAVKRKHLAGLKKQAAVVANREAELFSSIESAPDLFKKPRTLTLNGVKVGYTLSQGKVEWHNEDQVLALIKKYRKDEVDVLIHTKETPNKDALRNLPAGDLAKLGCRIDGAGDVVICKRVAGDVEKLVNKLIEKLVEAMVESD